MAKVEILDVNGVVVSSGDVMSNVAITGSGDNAQLKVYSGGLVSGGSITGAAVYTLSQGGILEGVTLNLGAVNTASGILSSCTIQNSKATNLNYASAFDCTVAAGGRLDANTGTNIVGSGNRIYGNFYLRAGSFADTTLYQGGEINAQFGTMDGIIVSGGTLKVRNSGAKVQNVTMYNGEMQVSSGCSASAVNVSGGTLTVSGGGLISGGAITGAAAYTLNQGAVLENVTLNLNASNTVYGLLSGCTIQNGTGGGTTLNTGSAYDCTVAAGGRLNASNGAAGSGNRIYGKLYLYGITFENTMVYNGAEVNVQSRSQVRGLLDGVVISGGVISARQGDVQNVTMYDGEIQVSSGCYAATVTISGGSMTVSSGGLGSNVTMTGGTVNVSSGAVVSGLTATGGSVAVSKGAALTDATLSGLTTYLLAQGAVFENVTLNLNATNTAYGLLSGCTIQNGGNNYTILNTGSAYDCTVAAGGRLNASNGAAGSGNRIYGDLYIYNITFENTTVYNGASVNVQSANKVRGLMDGVVISGGVISARQGDVQNVTMYGGEMQVSSGCFANMVIMSGGTMNVSSGALGSNVTMTGGIMTATGAVISGAVIHGGDANFSSGCSVTDLVLANDTPELETELIDSELTDAELDHVLVVRSSANGSVKVRGTITVSARFWMEGKVTTANAVDATGATFVLDLSRRNTDSTLVNKLDCVNGASFAIQVGSALAVGEYVLAGQASSFTDAITVKSGTTELGTMTVGSYLVAGDQFYGLSVKSDNKMYFSAASAIVAITANDKTISWNAVEGASGYLVSYSENNGTSWSKAEEITGTSYTYTGSVSNVQFKVQVSDGTNAGNASVLLSASADLGTVAANANAGDKIQLASGTYGTSAITVGAANVALIGQGKDSTTVSKAIYAAGNAVTVANLTASTNVAGGAVNAAATATDLNVGSALLKDAFAGSLVNAGTVEVASAGADLAGTTFRNLYGAGYATGTGNVLNNTTVELTVSGGCTTVGGSGCIYGAGRVANGARLNVSGTVEVIVDNGTASSGTLGGLYAGGYANTSGALVIEATSATIKSGVFSKFVAAGAQVYGENTSGTVTDANLVISGGEFNNAVLGASYAAGGASASVTSATTKISGGTFHGYVAGGGYVNASTLTVGNVNLTISGGTFTKYVFGGNISATKTESAGTQTGAVSLTLDATSNAISANVIYAGSMNSDTVASTLVELKGDGSKLSFSRLYGCGSYSGSQTGGVTGSKTLKFTGFSGDLSGRLYDFDTFTMSGSTVDFKQAQTLSGISTWNLALTSDVTDESALLKWSNGSNSFAGDTMKLTFNTDSTTALLVIEGGNTVDLALSNVKTVTFNGNAASYSDGAWSFGDWKLSNVNDGDGVNNLVLSKIA